MVVSSVVVAFPATHLRERDRLEQLGQILVAGLEEGVEQLLPLLCRQLGQTFHQLLADLVARRRGLDDVHELAERVLLRLRDLVLQRLLAGQGGRRVVVIVVVARVDRRDDDPGQFYERARRLGLYLG